MITGAVIGGGALLARFPRIPDAVRTEVKATVQKLGHRLEGEVKAQFLTGQSLKVRTGRLRSSITHGAEGPLSRQESTPTSEIYYVGTNIKYGRAWELGFTVPAMTIRPVKAKALHFMIGGKDVFAMSANIPGRTVAARPFLKPELEAMRPLIVSEIRAALIRGTQKAMKS